MYIFSWNFCKFLNVESLDNTKGWYSIKAWHESHIVIVSIQYVSVYCAGGVLIVVFDAV